MWFVIPVVVLFISLKMFTIFPRSLPQVHKKCRNYTKWKHHKHLWSISICYIQKGNTDSDVYRADVFLIPIEEMDFFFFSIIILCCIIAYCVISVSEGSNK